MSAPAAGAYIPGVEERLPAGERVLWHGRPSARAVARHVFHVRTLAAYFAALVCFRLLYAPESSGGTALARHAGIAAFAACAVAALALFVLVSVWVARSTVYAITDRRVVLRIGMAVPMTLNIPLACIESAGVRRWRDGSGEIALTLSGDDRFAYFVLWPHARPWHLVRPQPTLRGLEAPDAVGALLCAAAADAGGQPIATRAAPAPRAAAANAIAPSAAVAGD